MWTKTTWVNGKRRINGEWVYNWPSDSFTIRLYSRDRITGMNRIIRTCNDTPEWGNWKRLAEVADPAEKERRGT
jgi:hypothetical protein